MTGVTIIELDEGLDSGPVLTAQAVDVGDEEDAGTLTRRLAGVGARLIATVVDNYSEGLVVPVPQSDEGLTYATKISSADRPVGPDMSVADFVNRVRGLAPAPGAILSIDGSDHKVLAARRTTADVLTGHWSGSSGVPVVGLSDGAVELLLVQASGRRALAGDAWLRGHKTVEGRIG